jgi:hypothetical protein
MCQNENPNNINDDQVELYYNKNEKYNSDQKRENLRAQRAVNLP